MECKECNEEIYHNNPFIVREEGTYCYTCYRDSSVSLGEGVMLFLHSYEYKPTPKFHSLKNHKRKQEKGLLYLGVELEVEAERDLPLEDFSGQLIDCPTSKYYFKVDNSLDFGVEVVSEPCTLAYHLNRFNWERLLSYLRENGFESHNTESCGLHIHINKDFLTYMDGVKLGLFVYGNQYFMEQFSRRGENTAYSKYKKGFEQSSMGAKWHTHYNELARSDDRYEALNFTNYNTIEFRMFKGTLKTATFLATLEFVSALISYVKGKNSIEIMEKGYLGFIAFVCGGSKKQYLYLQDYLKLLGFNKAGGK